MIFIHDRHRFLLGALCLLGALTGCSGSTRGGDPAPAPATTSHNRFAFAGDDDGTVSVFGIDGADGALSYAGYQVLGTSAVQAVAVAPDNGHLYVLAADGTLGGYGIDARGALTRINTVNTGAGNLLLSGDGRFLYTVDSANDTVGVYGIDTATGALTARGTPLSAGATPVGIALAPSGSFAYVVNRDDLSVSVYARDGVTGALTPRTTTTLAAKPTAIALNPTGTFAYITFAAPSANVGVFSIDAASGDLAPVQTVSAGDTPEDIVLDGDDRFAYVAGTGSDRVDVFGIGTADGRLTPVQSLTSGPGPRRLALTPDDRYLYAAASKEGYVTAYTVDAASGRLALIDDTLARAGVNAVALSTGSTGFQRTAEYLFAPDNNVNVFAVNSTTGALGPAATGAAGTNPVQVALTPDDRYAYVANMTSNTLSVFEFDAAGGRLGSLVETVQAPDDWRLNLPVHLIRVIVEPSGRFLYLLDGRGTTPLDGRIAAYAIDPASGRLTYVGQVPSGGLNPMNLAVHPAGRYLYALNSGGNRIDQFTIDDATGALNHVNSFQAGQSGAGMPTAMTFAPNGRYAYVTLQEDRQLVRYAIAAGGDLTNAATVDVTTAEVPTDPRPRYIAVDPSGRYAYVSHWSGDISTWAVDPDTYKLSFVGTAPIGSQPSWIAVEPGGNFAYAVVTGGIDRLTVGTGGTLTLDETTSTGTGGSTYRTATIDAVIR